MTATAIERPCDTPAQGRTGTGRRQAFAHPATAGEASARTYVQSPLLAVVRDDAHRCPTGRHPEPSARCYNGAKHRCRCAGCRTAATNLKWDERHGQRTTRPAHPYTHMLRDLHSAGWTHAEIAAETGMSESGVKYLRIGARRIVQARTADAIRALWERTPLPITDVDPVAVERFVEWALTQPTSQRRRRDARPFDINDAERVEVARRLLDADVTPSGVGVLVGRSGAYLRKLIESAEAMS